MHPANLSSSDDEDLVVAECEALLELGELHRLAGAGPVGIVGQDASLLVVDDVVVGIFPPVAGIEEIGIPMLTGAKRTPK